MNGRPTKPPPPPPQVNKKATNYKKTAPPRPPPPQFLQLTIPISDRILSRPLSKMAQKLEGDMVFIASRLEISTCTLPDPNQLAIENSSINCMRLAALLHQIASILALQKEKTKEKEKKWQKSNKKQYGVNGAKMVSNGEEKTQNQQKRIKTRKRKKKMI